MHHSKPITLSSSLPPALSSRPRRRVGRVLPPGRVRCGRPGRVQQVDRARAWACVFVCVFVCVCVFACHVQLFDSHCLCIHLWRFLLVLLVLVAIRWWWWLLRTSNLPQRDAYTRDRCIIKGIIRARREYAPHHPQPHRQHAQGARGTILSTKQRLLFFFC